MGNDQANNEDEDFDLDTPAGVPGKIAEVWAEKTGVGDVRCEVHAGLVPCRLEGDRCSTQATSSASDCPLFRCYVSRLGVTYEWNDERVKILDWSVP